MSVPKGGAGLVAGDRAFCRNWSANRWTLVEIVEARGARFRVKHPDREQIFSAHWSSLQKVPENSVDPVKSDVEPARPLQAGDQL